MPIVLHQFGAHAAGGNNGFAIAKELAKQCAERFSINILPGDGGGIGTGSCWAAVAVMPNAAVGFPAATAISLTESMGNTLGAPLPYSVVFGNSQMATIAAFVPVPGAPTFVNNNGVVVPAFSGHAERNALLIAGHQNINLALYPIPGTTHSGVMFVQLEPCQACLAWLNGGGGGNAPNPYAARIGGLGGGPALTLHVWYRWDYPHGVQDMIVWNLRSRLSKILHIAGWSA